MPTISPELLEILVCPVSDCRAKLEQHGDRLVCTRCGLRYPIEQAWPVLIPELADPPQDQEA
ncbi:MAG TPA: Trm112 family protein [Phycisphaerae bacterium]|nr:Trm112 family protein [Phycisphaerae bacterium]